MCVWQLPQPACQAAQMKGGELARGPAPSWGHVAETHSSEILALPPYRQPILLALTASIGSPGAHGRTV